MPPSRRSGGDCSRGIRNTEEVAAADRAVMTAFRDNDVKPGRPVAELRSPAMRGDPMQRRVKLGRLWPGVAGIALAVSIIGLALLLSPHRVRSTWDAYKAIHDGMTLPEVEALLGGPEGDRSTYRTSFCLAMTAEECETFRSTSVTKEWINDDALILVGFDQEERVAWKFCTANRGGPPRWLDRVWSWLGFQ